MSRIAARTRYFGIAMTEPHAGSDVTALRAISSRRVTITGCTCYINGGARADSLEGVHPDARRLSVGGGTTEMMRNVLAGEVLGRRFSQKG